MIEFIKKIIGYSGVEQAYIEWVNWEEVDPHWPSCWTLRWDEWDKGKKQTCMDCLMSDHEIDALHEAEKRLGSCLVSRIGGIEIIK